MRPQHTQDNTRSSIIVIALLAAGVLVVAFLIGPSEKPEVSGIGVIVDSAEAAALAGDAQFELPSSTAADDGAVGDATTDQTGPADATESTEAAPGIEGGDTTTTEPEIAAVPAAPTPTPEIAAAVAPTAVGDTEDGAPAIAGAGLVPIGIQTGSFFISADEDAGATVRRNEITLDLLDDGTGSFAGVLDINRVDGTVITLSLAGPILWSTGADPQIEASLQGSYMKDSPTDADDVEATSGLLTVSSILTGAGSLCAETATGNCYGFTFGVDDPLG